MSVAIHRDSDPRACGATTTVVGQDNVFANTLLVSVDGDPNTHGGGALSAENNNVYINNKLVVNNTPESAAPDDLCPPLGGAHCAPVTAGGSDNVFVGDPSPAVPQPEVAELLGAETVILSVPEAQSILAGAEVERQAGNDPTTFEAVEYGDGGISTARRGNTSPVNQVTGPQDANAVNGNASPQPSNESGQYIQWLPHVDSRVKPQVVQNLERLSQIVGYQLRITSGYRSPDYNESVGGARNSQHMQGNAVDVKQDGLTIPQRQEFIQAAIDSGFTAIGVYNSFTHIDIRGQRVAWGNNGSRTTLPNYPWAVQVLRQNGYPI